MSRASVPDGSRGAGPNALIKTSELAAGPLAAVYLQGWFWILIRAVVAGAGIIAQIQMTRLLAQDLVVSYDSGRPF